MLMSQKILLNILNACIQIKAVGRYSLAPTQSVQKAHPEWGSNNNGEVFAL